MAKAVEVVNVARRTGSCPEMVSGEATSLIDGGAMTWEPADDGGGVLTLLGRVLWDDYFAGKASFSPVLSWRLPRLP